MSADLFDPEYWPLSELVGDKAGGGGRGSTYFVGKSEPQYALRHYYRGGLPGRIWRDQYFYLGEARTRSFREWRLLDQLYRMGLPVPKPVAARYSRRGLYYVADLLTERLPDVRSLAEQVINGEVMADRWSSVGATIRGFHAAGVFHADLNAHNVQLARGQVFLLDFDRGCMRAPGGWQEENLKRLKRSLMKVLANSPELEKLDENWRSLRAGYAQA